MIFNNSPLLIRLTLWKNPPPKSPIQMKVYQPLQIYFYFIFHRLFRSLWMKLHNNLPQGTYLPSLNADLISEGKSCCLLWLLFIWAVAESLWGHPAHFAFICRKIIQILRMLLSLHLFLSLLMKGLQFYISCSIKGLL